MKKTYLEKGFTLIELLVVIAIIGILSSVVLASLSSTRGKAQAVALKASLKSIQPAIAVCNGDVTTLGITGGSAVCAGNTALLPTAAQLGLTTVTYTVVGSAGGQSYTVTTAGHPVAACNVTNAITISESELVVPTSCK